MKKFILSLMAPVLSFVPAAQADEGCKVGKQVFTFLPTGETAYIGETEKNMAERKDPSGYLKIPDIRVEKRSGDHFPKDHGGGKVSDYIEANYPGVARYASSGTKFLKWEPGMLKSNGAKQPPVIETKSGMAYIKLGDIKGESISTRWIDKNPPVYALKSTCKD